MTIRQNKIPEFMKYGRPLNRHEDNYYVNIYFNFFNYKFLPERRVWKKILKGILV